MKSKKGLTMIMPTIVLLFFTIFGIIALANESGETGTTGNNPFLISNA